jgi:hypothetical protein
MPKRGTIIRGYLVLAFDEMKASYVPLFKKLEDFNLIIVRNQQKIELYYRMKQFNLVKTRGYALKRWFCEPGP